MKGQKEVDLDFVKRCAAAMVLELQTRRERCGIKDQPIEAMAKAMLKALRG